MSAEPDDERGTTGGSGTGDGLLRAIVVVLAAVLLLPVLMMAVAMPMMGMMGMWGMGGVGYSPLVGLVMGLVPLLVLVAVGYVVYRAVAGRGSVRVSDPALEELRLAYARGEISDEEFDERRRRLRRDRD